MVRSFLRLGGDSPWAASVLRLPASGSSCSPRLREPEAAGAASKYTGKAGDPATTSPSSACSPYSRKPPSRRGPRGRRGAAPPAARSRAAWGRAESASAPERRRRHQVPAPRRRGYPSPGGALTRRTRASRGSRSVAGWVSPPGTPVASCRPRRARFGIQPLGRWCRLLLREVLAGMLDFRPPRRSAQRQPENHRLPEAERLRPAGSPPPEAAPPPGPAWRTPATLRSRIAGSPEPQAASGGGGGAKRWPGLRLPGGGRRCEAKGG